MEEDVPQVESRCRRYQTASSIHYVSKWDEVSA